MRGRYIVGTTGLPASTWFPDLLLVFTSDEAVPAETNNPRYTSSCRPSTKNVQYFSLELAVASAYLLLPPCEGLSREVFVPVLEGQLRAVVPVGGQAVGLLLLAVHALLSGGHLPQDGEGRSR